jgi:Ca-activated chloride channel family protein
MDIRYIVPHNNRLCLYGATFRIGDRVITACLHEKTAAEETFGEAVDEGRAALLAQNLGNGLVEFRLGNIPPGERCEVEMKCALTATALSGSNMFFKFPLRVCTPSCSVSYVAEELRGEFSFELRNTSPVPVSWIQANVPGYFHAVSGTFTISCHPRASALIVTTGLREPHESECVTAGRYFALTYFATKYWKCDENNEFVFVIDCSGSMDGQRIAQARECLSIFIRSLPRNSLFNLVQFGSTFKALFRTTRRPPGWRLKLRSTWAQTSAVRTSTIRSRRYSRRSRRAWVCVRFL